MNSGIPQIVVLEKVDSTNNYAMALVQDGIAVHGQAVFSRQQTAGKGRRGKTWNASVNENIFMSLTLEMQWLPLFRQFELSAAIALACRDLAVKYVDEKIYVKWPNDLYVNDRKAGGILIENLVKGTFWHWAVVGIGINVNQLDFESYDPQPVSFKQYSGVDYDIIILAGELRQFVLKRIEQLKADKFSEILEEYNQNLFARNRQVRLKKGAIVFQTTVKKVSEHGRLITEDAIEREFDFDEVEFKGLVDDK
jgi:BirA family transcriptional regulator, biotin operon repressor / biotin---[acetyl-CoA-carboxylase] ligase